MLGTLSVSFREHLDLPPRPAALPPRPAAFPPRPAAFPPRPAALPSRPADPALVSLPLRAWKLFYCQGITSLAAFVNQYL